ncbi:hypothetical protein [Desulfofundulus thermocisternus]|uniref:hypothetical protein n=1 Tax=Desulfofundulus thermocisternus TaxID=42471 RepID=UPI00217EDE18|nr:hypothetical protein [Desulfofundulus thermocisternus]MCS5696334.1 hypothetical protein [Desulfofundulus thermocisternus]
MPKLSRRLFRVELPAAIESTIPRTYRRKVACALSGLVAEALRHGLPVENGAIRLELPKSRTGWPFNLMVQLEPGFPIWVVTKAEVFRDD